MTISNGIAVRVSFLEQVDVEKDNSRAQNQLLVVIQQPKSTVRKTSLIAMVSMTSYTTELTRDMMTCALVTCVTNI